MYLRNVPKVYKMHLHVFPTKTCACLEPREKDLNCKNEPAWSIPAVSNEAKLYFCDQSKNHCLFQKILNQFLNFMKMHTWIKSIQKKYSMYYYGGDKLVSFISNVLTDLTSFWHLITVQIYNSEIIFHPFSPFFHQFFHPYT